MEMEHDMHTWEGYVDYRFKPAFRGRHGGMRPALFVLVVEGLETLAFLANASNLVFYFRNIMNLPISRSAVDVMNFMGTAFLHALVGGFLSDAFFTSYYIYLMSAGLEFLGLIVLTIQARSPHLKPAPCDKSKTAICEEVHGGKAAMLFIGLYLVAIGAGGIRGSLPALGAEQFDETTPKGRKQTSSFFNYFLFCLSFGGLIAVTFVIWMEDNYGWQWGFGISTIAIVLSIIVLFSGSWFYRCKIPKGSPLTTMVKVLVAATLNETTTKDKKKCVETNLTQSPYPLIPSYTGDQEPKTEEPKTPQALSKNLKCLNRAAENKPAYKSLECSFQEVEDVKIMLQLLPIFASTVMFNCCLAQLSTFSVQQAATMNRKLGKFNVPPGSLSIFPILFMMILAPLYDYIIIPYVRKLTKSETGISHLQRIGIGLFLSIISMFVAGLVEMKRKAHLVSNGPLPISYLWLALQFLFLGSGDLFVLAGLMEFGFTEAPLRMRSLATSFSWASVSMGYYLSSVIVSVVNSITGSSALHHHSWLSGKTLDEDHLDRFYWLMCVLSIFNFANYLFWANRYKYKSISANI